MAKFKASDIELTDRENELARTRSTSGLVANINGFSGDTYNDSIRQAFTWMDEVNLNIRDSRIVELVCYFPQEHGGKAILVSYKTKTKKGFVDEN